MAHPMDVLADKMAIHIHKRLRLVRYLRMDKAVLDAIASLEDEEIYRQCPNQERIAWLRANDPRGRDNWNDWIKYQDVIDNLMQNDNANPWADSIIDHVKRHTQKPTQRKRGAA